MFKMATSAEVTPWQAGVIQDPSFLPYQGKEMLKREVEKILRISLEWPDADGEAYCCDIL
ncbi:MAG: hypothetical protein ACYC6G_00480 [Desulfobaccales bacterium]